MKTINELARALGVSRQTLYNVLNAEHVSIDELTTERQGKTRLFDDEAENIVKELLSKRGRNVKNVKDELDTLTTKLTEAEARIKDQAEILKGLRAEAETLRAEAERLRAEVAELRENNNILIKTNATNAVTIQTLQQERARLTSGEDQEHAEGWIRRTFRRIRGESVKE